MLWSCDEPLMLTEPPGPCGAGRFCVPTGVSGAGGPGCGAGLLCVPTGVSGAGGSGRCVCRWAAARPRAVRAASLARRVVSKPGQAPPPPTGTAADPSGALHTGGAWCTNVWFGASPRCPARPCRRPPAPWQIPPAPSTPVGPGVLRTGLARCLAIRPGPASAQGCRRQALDPRRGCLCRSHSGAFGYALLQTSSIGGVFRVDFCVVVTNVVNPTAFSLKIKVFGRRLTTFVT